MKNSGVAPGGRPRSPGQFFQSGRSSKQGPSGRDLLRKRLGSLR